MNETKAPITDRPAPGGTTVAPLPPPQQETPSQQPPAAPPSAPPVPVCKPQCDGKSCGPDGCGGVCGTCPNSSTCSADGATCECAPGTVPDPTFTACVPLGGACGNVSQYGHCVGDNWVRCDAEAGIVAIKCTTRCKTLPEYNVGSCECAGIDSQQGVCTSARGDGSRENVHLFCLDSLNILAAENCVQKTGMETGQCGTWVTAFGYQTMCHCGPCSTFINGRCVNSCRPDETCGFQPGGNVYRCIEPLPTIPR